MERPQNLHEQWDTDTEDLVEHLEVLVNDAVRDITHTLDSPLHDRDRFSLSTSIWRNEAPA